MMAPTSSPMLTGIGVAGSPDRGTSSRDATLPCSSRRRLRQRDLPAKTKSQTTQANADNEPNPRSASRIEASIDPARRDEDGDKHQRQFHKFGCPVAAARNYPQRANRSEHECRAEDHREVHDRRLQNRHGRHSDARLQDFRNERLPSRMAFAVSLLCLLAGRGGVESALDLIR
jgi:hypothetical protein